MEYTITKIEDDSYPFIKRLYKLCFNSTKSIEYVSKKYATHHFGHKNIGFIALSENNPAAYYGTFPLKLTLNGSDIAVAQSGDTMTAPNHRKQGLFIKLANKCYEYAKEQNIDFIFGFPNENSMPGFVNKLQWEFYDFMYDFTIESKALPFCELVAKLKVGVGIYESFVRKRLSKNIIPFSNEVEEKLNDFGTDIGYIKKNEDFFHYKTYEKNYLIKINGFIIHLKASTHLYIGAVSKFSPQEADKFIDTLKLLARKLACKKIILSLNPSHWLFSILENKITSKKSLPVGFLTLNKSIDYSKVAFSRSDYDTF